MLKVALIGCGKIADSHAAQIQALNGCEIVAGVDREPLMAEQLAERFGIPHHFSDLAILFETTRPDVVHITTPPQSHFALAKECLERGCHVYVEKPFTLHLHEAREILALAGKKGLKLTVGHDDQFSPAARRMRDLIRQGYLGGPPVHLESYYCYEYGDSYARAILGDKNHWVRSLPGGLLHNIISHGIARIAEFMPAEGAEISSIAFISDDLRRRGEETLVDELRVIIKAATGITAYFTFSSQMRPSLHQLRVYGPRNSLELDADQQVVLKLRGQRYKSYLEKFVPAANAARQYVSNAAANLQLFASNRFHMKAGMRFLIGEFYRSISEGSALPLSYEEILTTSILMDRIFAQMNEPTVSAQL